MINGISRYCRERMRVEMRFIQVLLSIRRGPIQIMLRFVKYFLKGGRMETRLDLRFMVHIHELSRIEFRISWDLVHRFLQFQFQFTQYFKFIPELSESPHPRSSRIDIKLLHSLKPRPSTEFRVRYVQEIYNFSPYDSSRLNLRFIYYPIRFRRPFPETGSTETSTSPVFKHPREDPRIQDDSLTHIVSIR